MTPITPIQFLELGYKTWKEIHWTCANIAEQANLIPNSYLVGFPNKDGQIIPFALWILES